MKQKIFQNFYQNIEQYEYSIDELNNNWINDNDIVGYNQNPDENTINQIKCNEQQQDTLNFLFKFAERNDLDYHLIVSGGAGVGKSVILKLFRQK